MRMLAVAAAALVLVGCGADPAATPTAVAPTPTAAPAETATAVPSLAPSEPFGLATVALVGPDETVDVPVYVAADPASRARGLMHRRDLPAGTGMLFVFPGENRGAFFMKDTLIPLSIAFYDAEGNVLEVLDMEPCGDADPCPLYDPGVSYVGALEVNQGFFDEIGLDESWRVELPAALPAPR